MIRTIFAGLGALLLSVTPAIAAPRDLNVQTDCGAKGDGGSDDTDKIQACISRAAHSGQAVYIPAGVYRLSGQLRIANNHTTIYGTSSSTTTLVQTNGTAHIFNISNDGHPIDRIQIRDLEMFFSTPNPKGFGILCNNCWRTYFQQLNIGRAATNAYMGTGIWVNDGNQVFVQDSVITYASRESLYFTEVGDVFLSDVEINQYDDSTSSVGAVFDTGVGGIYAINVNITGGHTGFLFQNTQNKVPPNFGFFTNCLADTLNGVGWNFQSAQSMRLTNSWSATAALHGVIVKNVDGLSITDSRIYNNGGDGILVEPGARNLTIKDSTITGNSRGAPRRHYGINVSPGVSDFQIMGNMIGQADGFANSQAYGIYIAPGASDNYMIVANEVRRNLAGGLQNGATGANKVVANNL
ncbi:glycosyl hydrolase family 28-related protein [Sphingomonas sp. AOB5]|uniref:right-handed parallel beta-helix repeat-containing protein n=1 Tax=Sphingomonas sp. AOB5 TaxID=3034017 RepID=UPI0023FA418B|nr:right-handed parallel beta-helix repeat-containing protein [Sphingomonas sp. AOB5]MDF7776107.1 glycosyl hydrolase family 28-related protein [Sphingomonas sp. AOB5]